MASLSTMAAGAVGGSVSLTVVTVPEITVWVANLLDTDPDQVGALAVSGAAGAFVRAVTMPEPSWSKRIFQGLSGALSALFLGGVFGHLIDTWTGAGPYAYLAGGFLLGEGGLAMIHAVRDRIMGNNGGSRK